MIFYGNGIVWDKENNKRLCKFVDGQLETDDKRIIEALGGDIFERTTDNGTTRTSVSKSSKSNDNK
jgi:hypothetical protein